MLDILIQLWAQAGLMVSGMIIATLEFSGCPRFSSGHRFCRT